MRRLPSSNARSATPGPASRCSPGRARRGHALRRLGPDPAAAAHGRRARGLHRGGRDRLRRPDRPAEPHPALLAASLRDRACRLLGAWAPSPPAPGLGRRAGAGHPAARRHRRGRDRRRGGWGWDVARACGRDRPLPEALAEALLRVAPLVVGDGDRVGSPGGRRASPRRTTSRRPPPRPSASSPSSAAADGEVCSWAFSQRVAALVDSSASQRTPDRGRPLPARARILTHDAPLHPNTPLSTTKVAISEEDRGLVYDLGTLVNRRRVLGLFGGVSAAGLLAACGSTGARTTAGGCPTVTSPRVPTRPAAPTRRRVQGVNVLVDSGIVPPTSLVVGKSATTAEASRSPSG